MKTYTFGGHEYQVLHQGLVEADRFQTGFAFVKAFRIHLGFVHFIGVRFNFNDCVTEVDRFEIGDWQFDTIKNAITAATETAHKEMNDTYIVPQEDEGYESQAV